MPLLFHRREGRIGFTSLLHHIPLIFFFVYNNNKCTATFSFSVWRSRHLGAIGARRSSHNFIFLFLFFILLTLLDSSFFILLSDASYAATGGRIVRRSAGTGGSGTASVQCASGNAGSVRPIGQTSTCIHPRCTGTASHLCESSCEL